MIKIIAVGKMTKDYLNDGIKQYLKQLSLKTEIIEVKDEKEISGMKNEGKAILDKIAITDYVITLEIEGEMLDSVAFSKKIDHILTHQSGDIVFVIGGSYGLDEAVKSRSNYKISFSKMTFPHQMIRLFLVEQIYRAIAIKNNHPYHK